MQKYQGLAQVERRINLPEKAALIVATGLGAGYFPKAPGTAGSLVGIPVGWLLGLCSPPVSLAILLLLTCIGVASATITEDIVGEKDPGIVVIDEIIGMAVSMWNLQFHWSSALVLFFLFRLFDIWKPFPVKQIENTFRGGLGIVMDDVMAGIFTNVFFRLGSLLLK